MAQVILYEKPGCPESVHIRFVVDKVALGQILFQGTQLCSVSTIAGMLHIHLHLRIHVPLATRANGRSPGKLPKSNVLSEIGGHCIEKFFHHYFVFKELKNTMQIAFIYCWPQSTQLPLYCACVCSQTM
jgi:hypothetical protein